MKHFSIILFFLVVVGMVAAMVVPKLTGCGINKELCEKKDDGCKDDQKDTKAFESHLAYHYNPQVLKLVFIVYTSAIGASPALDLLTPPPDAGC